MLMRTRKRSSPEAPPMVASPVEAREAHASPPIEAAASEARNDLPGRILTSLHRAHGVIELGVDGTILTANENAMAALGYELDDIIGHHHRILVDPVEAGGAEYGAFWADLGRGTFQTAEYRRRAKDGTDVWLQATYCPVLGEDGEVERIVSFATDVTGQRESERAIRDTTQAVIEFLPDGTIVRANDLFLEIVGYSLDDIVGQHHRIFMAPGEADTAEYEELWPTLARGEIVQDEFHRVDARGNDLWLRGTFTPVIGPNGAVNNIVKAVSDITDEVKNRQNATRVGAQIGEAVGEFNDAIREISETVSRTAAVAEQAESEVVGATAHIESLQATSERIGSVIDIIKSLSGQTNILALNATIEAARAGEAGRGFAVVANQVKELAGQTNLSANDIDQIINSIQIEIQEAVAAVEAISSSVLEVSDMTGTVAAAVEEQSALMSQLDSGVAELSALRR